MTTIFTRIIRGEIPGTLANTRPGTAAKNLQTIKMLQESAAEATILNDAETVNALSEAEAERKALRSFNAQKAADIRWGKPVPTAEETEVDAEVETVEEVVVESSIESIIEGENLSEEFKGKIALVFEAALSEEVAKRTLSIKESLEQNLETELSEAVERALRQLHQDEVAPSRVFVRDTQGAQVITTIDPCTTYGSQAIVRP